MSNLNIINSNYIKTKEKNQEFLHLFFNFYNYLVAWRMISIQNLTELIKSAILMFSLVE